MVKGGRVNAKMNWGVYITIITLLVVIIVIAFYTNTFRVIMFKQSEGRGVLAGQLKRGISCAMLPNPKGIHTFIIDVRNGRLRLNHSSYNPDGATWSLPPKNGAQQHFDMEKEGTYNITIRIGESYENTDRIELVNPEMWDSVEFSYKIE